FSLLFPESSSSHVSTLSYTTLFRSRYLKVPQISAVMGPCIAGGAYLPALSDIIIMVDGTSFMGLGGANLVKGATGQTIDNETLGDRKSTRLNSSHRTISYAVFCLKK